MRKRYRKSMLKRRLFVLLLLLISSVAFSNSAEHLFVVSKDTTKSDTAKKEPLPPLEFELKPTFGLGVGMFTFYGDVSNNHDSYHPTVSRVGYDLSITNPLTKYLDLSFYVLWGKIGTNERSLERNFNFESKITTGGAMLTYNFDHILRRDRVVEPYLGIGFESFEFLSKTDKYDAYGNEYNYWSDGTIRNLPEDDPNAGQAILIYRDYTYETDLREQNLDSLGKYPERSWAVPITFGANMLLNDRWTFKVGTSMHFTMTDLVDNLTGSGEGVRNGTNGNDKFLFTNVSLHYDLYRPKEDELIDPFEKFGDDSDLWAFDTTDTDQDGITDFPDDCPDTPAGVEVDERGCPLDGDKDGVPDYRDDELNTAEGAEVDKMGVTLTDEYFELQYRMFVDSTGEFVTYKEVRGSSESADGGRPLVITPRRKTYRVQKSEVPSDMIPMVLSLPDLRIEKDENGNDIYIFSEHDNLDSAFVSMLNVADKGVTDPTLVKVNQDGSTRDITDSVKTTMTDTNVEHTVASGPAVIRVQIGAFSRELSDEIFRGVPNVIHFKGDDGLYRYFSGSFDNIDAAATHKVDIMLKGFEDAFIVAYQSGKRIPLSKVGATISPRDDKINDNSTPNKINKELIKFRVQVGAYTREVPTDVLDTFLQIGNVEPSKSGDVMRYFVGRYDTYEEALKAQQDIASKGIPDAFVVGDFNGTYISSEEALKLLQDQE